MGTTELIFTGEGEPFLNPSFVEMIAIAKKAGFYVRAISNGTFLEEKTISSLLKSRLNALRISLWASSTEGFERHYPGTTPAYFHEIIAGVKRLSERKAKGNLRIPSVGLHQPITRHNFPYLEDMIPLAQETGCDALFFAPLKNRRGQLQEFTLSPEQEKDVYPTLKRIRRRLNTLNIQHNIDQTLFRYQMGEAGWKKLPCFIAWLHAHVKVDGMVLACNRPNMPLGNLHDHDFQTIWNAPLYRDFRRQTVTKATFASFGKEFDCGFCCHVENNARMHRIFRCFLPILKRRITDEIE
jgi:MoaA/NifB/PqqE/SkfB family radical SAM enzyme